LNIDAIAAARAKLEQRGVYPDRLEITGRDAAKCGIVGAGRILGLVVATSHQSRVGGYKHPLTRYADCSGREWEALDTGD
jgi:hypothetical protein